MNDNKYLPFILIAVAAIALYFIFYKTDDATKKKNLEDKIKKTEELITKYKNDLAELNKKLA